MGAPSKVGAFCLCRCNVPYPNEHAARVRDPGGFQPGSFRRKQLSQGVNAIMGRLKGQSSMTVQAYRFDRERFTAAEARGWLKENGVKYISFEAASGEKE